MVVVVDCRDLRDDFILDDVPLVLMTKTIGSWWNWKIAFTKEIIMCLILGCRWPSPRALPSGLRIVAHAEPAFFWEWCCPGGT